MNLTPRDIQNWSFRKRLHGYHPDEVRQFLQRIADLLEDVLCEHRDQKEEVVRLNQRLLELHRREDLVCATLRKAEATAQEQMVAAQRKGELICQEAELKAEEIVRAAEEKARGVKESIRDLKEQRHQFLQEMESLLARHQRLLDSLHQEETQRIRLVAVEEEIQRDPSTHLRG